ncbi:MAG: hypothetical protein IT364_13025 [Candidatus Hydrogenedentes bacterium]|nr:hypothetical protein [Candidatus Hydrogenedentota bacterium]
MRQQADTQPFSMRDEETISFIPDDLKVLVVQILKEGNSNRAIGAIRELHEKATNGDPYLVASSVYDFLWKKVASDARKNLYPLVGDFFLTALEQRLAEIGPNNMTSRFLELMECYRDSADQRCRLEGPLYCVDLFLLKSTQLVLGARNSTDEQLNATLQDRHDRRPQFLEEDKLTLEQQIQHSLDLAKDALLDTQEVLSKVGKEGNGLNPSYIRFIRSTMDRLTLSWQHWQEMHAQKNIMQCTPEEYFKQGIARAEKVNSLVLAALLLEQVGAEYQDKMCREFLNHRFSNKPVDHPMRGCIFDAAEIYRDQGIEEREQGAFILSERRFTRAISLFGQLRDRTSVAQTLIERARMYITREVDAWKAKGDLYLAAQNIAAAHKRLAPGQPLPALTPEQVMYFYEHKGLNQEAHVYRHYEPALQMHG